MPRPCLMTVMVSPSETSTTFPDHEAVAPAIARIGRTVKTMRKVVALDDNVLVVERAVEGSGL